MSRRNPGPRRRKLTATASWLAAVFAALMAFLGALNPGGVFLAISAAVTAALALLTVVLERAPRERFHRSFDSHPIRSFAALGAGIVLFFGWVPAVDYLLPRFDLPTPADRAAVIGTITVLIATVVDPFTRAWRHNAAASLLRWGRNGTLMLGATYVFIGAYYSIDM